MTMHIYDTTPQPGDVNESLDFMVPAKRVVLANSFIS